MAVRKSVRVTTGRGGRPTGEGVRHTTSHIHREGEIKVVTPDEAIARDEEIEFDIRETIRTALVENQNHLSTALANVAELDPKAFLTAYKDYAEFILPKLQRTDSKLDSSNPIEINYESVDDHVKRKEEEEAKNPKINPDNDFPTND